VADAFSSYLANIVRYPLLSKEQEIMLARDVQVWLQAEKPTKLQIRRGERSYQKLINCNLRLVVSVAKKFRNRINKSEMLDIIQEGNMGLAHGIKKFDPERGYALSTYVYWWIRQAISRYLSCNDRVIRLPSHAVEMLSRIKLWSPQFHATHGRYPNLQECAEYCNSSVERMRLYLDNSYDALSLDAKVNTKDSDTQLIDLITDGVDIMEDLDMVVSVGYLPAVVERLEGVDKDIIINYYGLNGVPALTLKEIGDKLGISRERVRQRHNRSLLKLRVHANQISTL
jgi:RNA polymerase sigma factor (sigma-70 family)